jgi:hypothetical protein
MPEIITSGEARAKGLKRFRTPGVCKVGHVDPERYVVTGACCECQRVCSRNHERTPEGRAKKAARYVTNREVNLAKRAVYRAENANAIRTKKAAYNASPEGKVNRVACLAANREHILSREAAYRTANREDIRAKRAGDYAANRTDILAKKAAWYLINREAELARRAAYYSRPEVKEIRAAYDRERNQTPRGRALSCARNAARRAAKLSRKSNKPVAPNVFDWWTPIEAQEVRAAGQGEWSPRDGYDD